LRWFFHDRSLNGSHERTALCLIFMLVSLIKERVYETMDNNVSHGPPGPGMPPREL
jgi:hypothetical protein